MAWGQNSSVATVSKCIFATVMLRSAVEAMVVRSNVIGHQEQVFLDNGTH